MATRTVTTVGIRRPHSNEAWAGVTVTFRLQNAVTTGEGTFPVDKVPAVTDADGIFSVELEAGLASRWVFQCPGTPVLSFVLEPSDLPITIEELRALSGLPPVLTDPLQVALDAGFEQFHAALAGKVTAAEAATVAAAVLADYGAVTAEGALAVVRAASGTVGRQALLGVGDSNMAAPALLAGIAAHLGVTDVVNLGQSGWSSSDIAIRQGGLDPLLTVASNQIPASGAVTVTTINPATSYRTNGSGSKSWLGVLAGVPGTLTHNMDTATWSFTRTAPGSAVACPAGTPFHCTTADQHRDRITIYWLGRNNIADLPSKLLDTVRDVDLMIAHQTDPKRFLVIGVMPSSTEASHTARGTAIANHNAYLAQRYGSRFVDIATLLRTTGLAQVGLAPTANDATDIASGLIPRALMVDSIHLNDLGNSAAARIIANVLASLGSIPGVIPPPLFPTHTMVTSDSFNRADTAANAIGTSDAAYGGTGAAWAGSGEVRIVGNTLGRQTASAQRTAVVAAGTVDQRVSVRLLKVPAASLAGVILRYSDASNYYSVSVDSTGAVQINRRVGGVSAGTAGPTDAGTFVAGDTLEGRIKGDELQAYVNGVMVLRVTSTALTTGSSCGLLFPSSDAAVAFDDFRAWAL